jgi:glycerol-3-phosphate dehydrogenase
MALTVADVLIRRTRLAFRLRDNGLSLAPVVAKLMAPALGWSADQERDAAAAYAREAARMFRIE